jgi:sialate O-acetylesterase
MKIESGLLDHMVLQRNMRNTSEAAFVGLCAASGVVMATVRRDGKTLRGFAGRKVGMASGGKLGGCLKGLPAGGPYNIELRVGDEKLAIHDVLVGDVWLVGGQSNMQGYGYFSKPRPAFDPQVRAFFMDDRWGTAKDPIHNMWKCVDQVHVDLSGGVRPQKPAADWGACPGPSFGNEMRRLTGVPQGLIACAHGGTSMTQWDPQLRKEGGKSLYGAMIRRLRKNGGRVAGLVWYQGESDANPGDAGFYTGRMKKFAASLRRDSGNNALPIVIVQIARVIGWGSEMAGPWNSVQDQQGRLPQVIRNLEVVPAVDLPLDDIIHISGAGQQVLGVRLARTMQVLRAGRKAGLPPIRLRKTTIETEHGLGVVVMEFENVAGKLRSGDRPAGFFVVTENGSTNVFDIQLDGSRARIRTHLSRSALAGAIIHYGYGTDPYCNITDEAGRSLPVFGPLRLGAPRAITPFVRQMRVSAFQPAAEKLRKLKSPISLDALQMKTRTFEDNFCNLNPEIAQHGGDHLVFFACRFSCKEAMPLALVLGYDGPVKAWVDGREIFCDTAGSNPATEEDAIARFRAGTGEHDAVIALETNNGMARGIFLRIERFGIPRKQLCREPGNHQMPEILG